MMIAAAHVVGREHYQRTANSGWGQWANGPAEPDFLIAFGNRAVSHVRTTAGGRVEFFVRSGQESVGTFLPTELMEVRAR